MDTGCGFRFDNFRKQCSGELELYIDYRAYYVEGVAPRGKRLKLLGSS